MKLDIEFTFEGFRIMRKRPWAVASWGLVFLVANVIGFGSFAAIALPVFSQLSTMSGPADPAALFALIGSLALPYGILFITVGLASVLVSSAIFRVVLSEEKPGFGYLRFGGDEWRMILVHIIYVFLFLGVYIAMGVAGVALGFVFRLIDENLFVLGMIISIFGGVGVMIWLAIRLSLGAVQSFDEKRINLFGSWKLTKGHFWTLLGGYLLAAILAMLIETIVMTVVWFFGAIVMVLNLDTLKNLGSAPGAPDIVSLMWVVGPMMVGYIAVFSLVAWPMMTAIMVGAPAAAYRALNGRNPAGIEKFF